MTIAGLFICILCLLYLLYLGAEKLLARRYRRSLLHVIQVNGIRGKSSTVRLVDAGLRAGGFRVVSKSTGTLPMILHTDGWEEEIRRGPRPISGSSSPCWLQRIVRGLR